MGEGEKITSVWSKRLNEAKDKQQFLKLIFQYPNAQRSIVKRGYVTEVFDDGFDFNERFDGECSYAFKFLMEVKKEDLYDGNI